MSRPTRTIVLFQPFAETLSTQTEVPIHYRSVPLLRLSFLPLMMVRYDGISSSTTVLLLLAGTVIFTAVEVQSRDLDCRRFVFAPICRGATIKRSFVPNDRVIEEDVRELVINNPKQEMMEAESQPFFIPVLIDRRFLDVRSPRNSHQAQLDAED